MEIDGFTVRVCNEIDVKLTKHRVRSLGEVEKQGGFVGSFDLIIAMTEQSLKEVKSYTKYDSVKIERWSIDEPERNDSDLFGTLDSYRKTRDMIHRKIVSRL